jgi:hypothetical protein
MAIGSPASFIPKPAQQLAFLRLTLAVQSLFIPKLAVQISHQEPHHLYQSQPEMLAFYG